ncbi:alkaline phosphatase family protein [Domibacillus sp. A3M-37]|uniref:alkaline phosphatase family protein n=1 Tax=Domibacillus sp. A3M-37 TaxID=2962037 RepID=UPI0020B6C86A|nr:alkaline phosphatase family protein [Domibacillus sp. A3M-37]MCP3760885.1 alkaline phosphatase family protein [Domibacillus sp. A3M-37]
MKKLLLSAVGLSLCLNPFSVLANESGTPVKDQDVIVISFDGMRHDLTKSYMESGSMPNMRELTDKGVWAERPKTIMPSLTAPSHAAMSTGATPNKTGIVSNQFHDPDKEFNNKDDAFHTTINVSPIWSEASRQGKTTATVAFPGANPYTKNQAADYSVFYGDTWATSSLEQLSFEEASNWIGIPKSFSALKEAILPLKLKNAKNRTLYVLAADTTDDQKTNYDQFILSENKQVDEWDGRAKSNEWGAVPLTIDGGEQAGFSFKVKRETTDLTEPVPFFKTAVTSGLLSGPDGFEQAITDQFGFFPVESEDEAFEKKWITRREYEEINARFVTWITDVSLYIKETYEPDALFFYGPQIDHEEHHYTLTDPRQPGYTKNKADLYESYVKWAYKLADDTAGKTMSAMDENDHLFIVSDHGMEAAHTMLQPNAVLKKAGLLTIDQDGKIDFSKTKVYAVPSGSAAHVYINAKSTGKNGIVADNEVESVQQQAINAFKQVEVKLKNQDAMLELAMEAVLSEKEDEWLSKLPEADMKDVWQAGINRTIHPYERIISSPDSEEKPLGHAHSGDILLIGAPGYMMANGTDKTSKSAAQLGTHGGDSAKQDLRPVFTAIGSSFKEGETVGKISTLDLAPTIYDLLGIKAPAFIEGEIKTNLWKWKKEKAAY